LEVCELLLHRDVFTVLGNQERRHKVHGSHILRRRWQEHLLTNVVLKVNNLLADLLNRRILTSEGLKLEPEAHAFLVKLLVGFNKSDVINFGHFCVIHNLLVALAQRGNPIPGQLNDQRGEIPRDCFLLAVRQAGRGLGLLG